MDAQAFETAAAAPCASAKEALARKVRERRADVGIALDGDGDRTILIDGKGRVIDGDQAMAVIAGSRRGEGRLAKAGVVARAMANLGLERRLRPLSLERNQRAGAFGDSVDRRTLHIESISFIS